MHVALIHLLNLSDANGSKIFFHLKEHLQVQWNLSAAGTIGTSEECPLYRGVRYIDFPPILVYFAWEVCSMLLGDSAIDSRVCQEAVVEKSLREYIREPDVVGESLQ